jgi:thiaminase
MKPNILKLLLIGLALVFSGTLGLSINSAGAADAECGTRSVNEARNLIGALRAELVDSERQVQDHPYLRALEEKQISLENLKDFAGEQYNIIQSDLRSDALMVSRFGATQSGTFLREIMDGEAQALSLLLDFARALGLNENQLQEYEPRPRAQAYPSYVVSLALYGSEAEIGAAFLVNFPSFGNNARRMSAALQGNYGLTQHDVAFFDLFTSPIPNFECNTLVMIQAGLDHGVNPRLVKRAARLLQAYEKLFWDTVAEQK